MTYSKWLKPLARGVTAMFIVATSACGQINKEIKPSDPMETMETKDDTSLNTKALFVGSGGIATFYDSGSRIIYAITDKFSPVVDFTGRNLFNYCNAPKTNVKAMMFMPENNISKGIKAGLTASARANGMNISGFASAQSRISYKTPAVYYYQVNSLIWQVHFNVFARDSRGNTFNTGWLPDDGGGCTYKLK